jgi:hypothetical protein
MYRSGQLLVRFSDNLRKTNITKTTHNKKEMNTTMQSMNRFCSYENFSKKTNKSELTRSVLNLTSGIDQLRRNIDF